MIKIKMNENMTVRLLEKEEFDSWDKFVDESEQGNIFCKSFWSGYICSDGNIKFCIYGVFNKHGDLIAGLPIYHRKKAMLDIAIYPPVTPFMGILYGKKNTKISKIESYEREVIAALTEKIRSDYSYISLALDPSIMDLRPFKFEGWESHAVYTYYVGLSDIKFLWDNLDRNCKKNIKKSQESNLVFSKETDIKQFYDLYSKTYLRQNMAVPASEKTIRAIYTNLKEKGAVQLYSAKKDSQIIALSLVIFDKKRAYYLLAASDPDNRQYKAPSFLLWNILEDISGRYDEIDLVGANTPSIIMFKKGFATKLVPYYVVSNFSNKLIKLLFNIRNKFI